MSSQSAKEWRIHWKDMIRFAETARRYTLNLDQSSFVGNELVYDATLRNLELLGEAANSIPQDVRDAHPDIPWRKIIGVRNRLAHAYLSIDDDTIWSVLQDDLPVLIRKLKSHHSV